MQNTSMDALPIDADSAIAAIVVEATETRWWSRGISEDALTIDAPSAESALVVEKAFD